MKRHCCRIGCEKDADYMIIYGPTPDDFTDSCLEDIPVLMTDAGRHEIVRLESVANHRSDCAVYNEPAYPKRLCDCGLAEQISAKAEQAEQAEGEDPNAL